MHDCTCQLTVCRCRRPEEPVTHSADEWIEFKSDAVPNQSSEFQLEVPAPGILTRKERRLRDRQLKKLSRRRR